MNIGIRDSLIRKEKEAINFIRNAESIALEMSDKGFHLSFSGGKDSQVIYALAQSVGIKFHAEMQVTTVDPPELMKFVRRNYKDVILNRPYLNMYQLIRKYKMLPIRRSRYCCAVLKEQTGNGGVRIIGIRAAESHKRAKRNEVEVTGHKYSGSIDQFNISKESIISCVKGKDQILPSPIFRWTDADVWNYIRNNKMSYCELYNCGFHRIGCMFCPMSRTKTKQLELIRYPGVAKEYIKSIQYLIDTNGYGSRYNMTADEIFFCWINNKSFASIIGIRKQLKLDI